jgi:hypothetical protein
VNGETFNIIALFFKLKSKKIGVSAATALGFFQLGSLSFAKMRIHCSNQQRLASLHFFGGKQFLFKALSL